MPDSMKSIERVSDPRKGMPSRRIGEQEFKRRFLENFIDPTFDRLQTELEQAAAAAWDANVHSRKSPRTRKAGSEFADPEYELSVDWLAARDAIQNAKLRHDDRGGPS